MPDHTEPTDDDTRGMDLPEAKRILRDELKAVGLFPAVVPGEAVATVLTALAERDAENERLRHELDQADAFGRGEFRVTQWAYDQAVRVMHKAKAEAALAALAGAPAPTDLPLVLASPDDVGRVCLAAGLTRDGDEWRDERVAVRAVTTSCSPLSPGDDRDMVGIFVTDTDPSGPYRSEELSEQVSGALLLHVIRDVQRTGPASGLGDNTAGGER